MKRAAKTWLNPSEKMIENSILYWLNFEPDTFAFKLNSVGIWDPKGGFYRKSSRFAPVGGSDIIVCREGRFGALEVKVPSEYEKFFRNPGPHEVRQQMFIDRVKKAGGFGYVVKSLEQTQDVLRTLTRGPQSSQIIE